MAVFLISSWKNEISPLLVHVEKSTIVPPLEKIHPTPMVMWRTRCFGPLRR